MLHQYLNVKQETPPIPTQGDLNTVPVFVKPTANSPHVRGEQYAFDFI